MSRSGYSDDCDGYELAMYRGVIASATRGKRGQRFFVDLVGALDALPEKALIASELQTKEGAVCALGALAKHKGLPISEDDTYDHDALGEKFDIARQLAAEVMFENDEARAWVYADGKGHPETPEERWKRVRAWAAAQIKDPT